jgi:hypothetical protein
MVSTSSRSSSSNDVLGAARSPVAMGLCPQAKFLNWDEFLLLCPGSKCTHSVAERANADAQMTNTSNTTDNAPSGNNSIMHVSNGQKSSRSSLAALKSHSSTSSSSSAIASNDIGLDAKLVKDTLRSENSMPTDITDNNGFDKHRLTPTSGSGATTSKRRLHGEVDSNVSDSGKHILAYVSPKNVNNSNANDMPHYSTTTTTTTTTNIINNNNNNNNNNNTGDVQHVILTTAVTQGTAQGGGRVESYPCGRNSLSNRKDSNSLMHDSSAHSAPSHESLMSTHHRDDQLTSTADSVNLRKKPKKN